MEKLAKHPVQTFSVKERIALVGGNGDIPDKCECDNTHHAVNTVCRYCWAYGRRTWDDPKVPNPVTKIAGSNRQFNKLMTDADKLMTLAADAAERVSAESAPSLRTLAHLMSKTYQLYKEGDHQTLEVMAKLIPKVAKLIPKGPIGDPK